MQTIKMAEGIRSVQVNIPFSMLYNGYLGRFLKYRLNPDFVYGPLGATCFDRYMLPMALTKARTIKSLLWKKIN